MEYWSAVLREVLDRNKQGVQFRFTNLGVDAPEVIRSARRIYQRRHKPGQNKHATYEVDANSNVKLTKREAQSLYHLMSGKSIADVARMMALSSRTIEFYVKNIRAKLHCRNKDELLKLVATMTFMQDVHF